MKKKKRVRKIYIDLNFSAVKLITMFPNLVGQIVTDCPFLFLFLQNPGGQMLTMPTCFRRL